QREADRPVPGGRETDRPGASERDALRGSAAGRARSHGAPVVVRLPYRAPLAADVLFRWLAARAVPGVEDGGAAHYRRALVLPHGTGTVTVLAPNPGERFTTATFAVEDLRDLATAVKRVRLLFDLDADPEAVAEVLGNDPLLRPGFAALPGLRVPGAVDGNEVAARAVLGQQVSVAGARALAGRLADRYGRAITTPDGAVTRAFPTASALAGATPEDLPLPASRARTLVALAEALASGTVDLGPGADREEATARLQALPGVGPWTVAYIRMRALGDPDAFPAGDLGLRRALEALGRSSTVEGALSLADAWRPYRAYALQYLWSGALGHPNKEEVA
ncbi:MAG TPA: DNA-3-methyladenine glycosylase, partial [Acidimicrobiales bacterium]|nr:DNA-3-methyladenine glycosylase [Acidimicrobiales bacterium]